MEDNAVTALSLAGDEAVGFSLWSLVMQADPVVQTVLRNPGAGVDLVVDRDFRQDLPASRGCAARRAPSSVPSGPAPRSTTFTAALAAMPITRWRSCSSPRWRSGATRRGRRRRGARALLERIGKVMSLTLERELEILERHLSSLATIGSTAPFVGLFGTVWGIMNSFQSIALTKNTTLAVVAPGIAEALLATALGLVAAIPAVIAYNKLSGDLDRYATRVTSFADEFSVVLSRELESGRGRSGIDSSRAA